MEWCRLYGEMLDDPKVGTLSDAEYRTWIELLLVATKADANGCTKLSADTIDWALRRNATVTLQVLLQRELVTLDETGLIVINAWADRQKKGDSSAGRVKKFRENQRLSSANEDVTLQKRDANALEKSREEKIREEVKTKTPRAPRFDAQAHLVSLGVDPKVSEDWLALRKKKNLAPTETAFDGVRTEAKKVGMTMDQALRTCCTRGWGGFDAAWLNKGGGGGGTNFHDDRKSFMDELTGRNRHAAIDNANIIDI